jgi:hypothetical protein
MEYSDIAYHDRDRDRDPDRDPDRDRDHDHDHDRDPDPDPDRDHDRDHDRDRDPDRDPDRDHDISRPVRKCVAFTFAPSGACVSTRKNRPSLRGTPRHDLGRVRSRTVRQFAGCPQIVRCPRSRPRLPEAHRSP